MDIEEIRACLRDEGNCRPCVDGFLYNTIHNCSREMLIREVARGWEVAGIFRGADLTPIPDISGTRNIVVLRRAMPSLFTDENSWKYRGPHPWLPLLTSGVTEALAAELANGCGHDNPVIARRLCCRCRCNKFTLDYNLATGYLHARCLKCRRRSVVLSLDSYQSDCDSPLVLIPTLLATWLHARKDPTSGDPYRFLRYRSWLGFLLTPRPPERVQHYRCRCGKDQVMLDLGIEYPVTTTDGWDFSWVTAAANCLVCKEHEIFFSVETAGLE